VHLVPRYPQKVCRLRPILTGASGHFHESTLDRMDLILNCVVPVTFSSCQPLKAVPVVLALSILIAFPPEVVLLMYLFLGPLQGAHRSIHFGY
jgi:hypothetical protein